MASKFCNSLDIDDVGYVSLTEVILRIQNTLAERSISLAPVAPAADATPAVIAAFEDRCAKQAKSIIKVVYKNLSDTATGAFTSHRTCTNSPEVMTWPKIRLSLLACFSSKIDVQQIRHTLNNCVQGAAESPRSYYTRLLIALHCLRIGLDHSLGSGLDGSAGSVGAVTTITEPFYFVADYINNDMLKTRYFQGLSQEIRKEWNHVHSANRANGLIAGNTLTQLLEWAERHWLSSNRIAADSKRSIPLAGKKNLHSISSVESDDSEYDFGQSFQISKRNKMEVNPLQQLLDSNNAMMDAQRQQHEKLMSSLLNVIRPNNTFQNSERKEQNFSHGRPPPNRNRFSGKSITTLVKPKSCWICRGDHFAQHCPAISRLEQLILLFNRVYRLNRGKVEPGTTIDKLCISENVAPPMIEENALLDRLYKPLRESQPKKLMGKNTRAYCHFCHATGHWTRECKSYCPYCQANGHGWEVCTNLTFASQIRTRLSVGPLLTEMTVLNALFSLVEMDDNGDEFVTEEDY